MEETSHGRHSNAFADAAEEAKKLGVDAVPDCYGSDSIKTRVRPSWFVRFTDFLPKTAKLAAACR
jgi:hypothetical protein